MVEFRADGSLLQNRYQNPDGSEFAMRYEYNEQGRLIAVQSRNATQSYDYDAEGRLLRVRTHSQEGIERLVENYAYDTDGLKTKTLFVDQASQQPNTSYSWGVEGIDSAYYSAQNAATLTTRYNKRQHPIELVFHDEAGQLLSQVHFSYDEAGNLVEEAQTKQAEALPPEIRNQLSPEQWQTVRAFLAVEKPLRRLHRYNERGRRIEIRSEMASLGSDYQRMVYNEQGDVDEEIFESESRDYNIDETGQLAESPTKQQVSRSETRLRYEYDSHGNWLKKVVESRSGNAPDYVPASIEVRTIEYFEATYGFTAVPSILRSVG